LPVNEQLAEELLHPDDVQYEEELTELADEQVE